MLISIKKTGGFCAAHHLPGQGGKCEMTHGHNYKVSLELGVTLPVGKRIRTPPLLSADLIDEFSPPFKASAILDFYELSSLIKVFCEKYDHRYLNDFQEFGTKHLPTAENLAIMLVRSALQLVNEKGSVVNGINLPVQFVSATVYETDTSQAKATLHKGEDF